MTLVRRISFAFFSVTIEALVQLKFYGWCLKRNLISVRCFCVTCKQKFLNIKLRLWTNHCCQLFSHCMFQLPRCTVTLRVSRIRISKLTHSDAGVSFALIANRDFLSTRWNSLLVGEVHSSTYLNYLWNPWWKK